jgi:hypothetical protein
VWNAKSASDRAERRKILIAITPKSSERDGVEA